VFFLIVTIVQVFKTTFRVVHMVYSSRLYPRAEPRGFSLQWIKSIGKICQNQNKEKRTIKCQLLKNSGFCPQRHPNIKAQ
ncbi:hypothetical protein, partial [Acinetobacter sp. AL9]|uniref:hypothetical protein n=1 Tax=Acinetobacter sp. AL9 TaxID=3273234 RepID=UPI0035572AA8